MTGNKYMKNGGKERGKEAGDVNILRRRRGYITIVDEQTFDSVLQKQLKFMIKNRKVKKEKEKKQNTMQYVVT